MLGVSTEADLSGPGALTLHPDGIAEIRHVIGAISWPTGEPVSEIRTEGETLLVIGEAQTTRRLPFDTAFLRLAGEVES